MTVLIVEDDPGIARSLEVNLDLDSYKTLWADSLKKAFDFEESKEIDLVLLDLGLGNESGFDFLVHLSAKKSNIPVIILSAQTDEDSVVRALEMGAKDYLRKPFGLKELLARIRSVTHTPQNYEKKLNYAGLLLLLDQRQVLYNDKNLSLNRREFDLLAYLIKQADRIVSREALIESIGKELEIFDRTIDSHISHLRKKLRKEEVKSIKISSVYGVGYRLEQK